jgi:uncharacterized membrane protein YqhA
MTRRAELALGAALFRVRWLPAPFCLGLVVAMVLLLARFAKATLASVDPILKRVPSCLVVSGVLFALMDRIADRHKG